MKKIYVVIAVITAFILVGAGCAHRAPQIGAGADLPGMSYQEYLEYKNKEKGQTETANTETEAKAAEVETAETTATATTAQAQPAPKEKTGRVEAPPRITTQTQTANPGDLEKRVARLENQVGKNSHRMKQAANQTKANTHNLKRVKGRVDHLYGVVSFNVKRTTAMEDRNQGRGELAKAKVNFIGGSGAKIKDNTNKVVLDKAIKEGITPKVIIGVSDPSGSKKVNTRLAEERAKSLKNYLKENGVDVSNVKTLARPEAYLYGTCGPQNRAAMVYYKKN